MLGQTHQEWVAKEQKNIEKRQKKCYEGNWDIWATVYANEDFKENPVWKIQLEDSL